MPRLHALLCLAVPACASATDADDVVGADETRTFFVTTDDAKVTLRAALDDDQGVADLVLDAGWISLADGEVDELTLAVHDVPLPEEIYPGDIVLTDILASLAEPGSADLVLSWSAVIGGELHPLATQTLTGFTLDVADHGDVVDVSMRRDGVFFEYLGATLADAVVEVRASSVIVP